MSGTKALGADFVVPADDRYLEDYEPGAVYEFGYVSVTEAEIVEFGTRFDPQPMHVDPEWARMTGPFGGLIASGWHSAGLLMRLYADHYLTRVASIASPGVDEVRWAVPLRPGDRLRLRTTVVSTRVSRSRPDRGILVTSAQLYNDDGGCPLSCRATNIILRRPVAGGPTGGF